MPLLSVVSYLLHLTRTSRKPKSQSTKSKSSFEFWTLNFFAPKAQIQLLRHKSSYLGVSFTAMLPVSILTCLPAAKALGETGEFKSSTTQVLPSSG